MAEKFVNDPGTALSVGCTSSATTITVVNASGYPTTGNFRIKIDDELMIVTSVSGAVWTVTRGAESTTATAHAGGTAVNHVFTAGAYQQALADRNCYVVFRAALQQSSVASLGFSYGADGPTAVTVTGTTSLAGAASFAAGAIQRVHDHFLLPSDYNGIVQLDVLWRTTATTNSVKWQIEVGAIASGAIFDPTLNTATVATVSPAGTTLQTTLTTITGIDTTGLAANKTCYFRFSRLGTTDTLTSAAELLALRFVLSRTI